MTWPPPPGKPLRKHLAPPPGESALFVPIGREEVRAGGWGWGGPGGDNHPVANLKVVCKHGTLAGRRPPRTIARAVGLSDGQVLWDHRGVSQHGQRVTLRLHCPVCRFDLPLGEDGAAALWRRGTGDTPGEHVYDWASMR